MNRLILVLALFLVACGDDKEENPVRPDGGVSMNDAGISGGSPSVARLAQAVCNKQTECCAGNESVTECSESFDRAISPIFTLGGIAVDENKFNACVATLSSLSCEAAANYGGRVPFGVVCEKFYSGTLADGADCDGATIVERVYSSSRCASGHCDGTTKKCAPAPVPPMAHGQGEDCSQDGLCVEGLQCFGEPMTCQTPTEIMIGEICEAGTICELGESQCFCPFEQEGCLRGTCGNRSRCRD
jgi:hypothetical protein